MNEHQIPADWAWKPLSQLANIVSGGTPSRVNPAFWGGSIPWVTPSDITSRSGTYLTFTSEFITEAGLRGSSAKLLPKGSVLMTSRATLGQAKLAMSEVCTNQGFKSLVPHEDVDGLFLLYQMQLHKDRYANYGTGTTFLEVNKKDTSSFEIPVPPTLSEQRRIATMLFAMDEQIDKSEALIQKTKLGFMGLKTDLLSCRRLSSSQISDVLLRQLIPSVQYGISSSLGSDGEVPVLRMNNLSGGEVDVSELKYAKVPVADNLLLRDGDVLFNRTNSLEHVGRTSIWRSQIERATFASYLVRLNPDAERITNQYLVYLLGWEVNQTQMRRYATPGVQQVNINPTNLRLCRVRVPTSLSVQRHSVEALDAYREYLTGLAAEVRKLKVEKQGLLLDLLAGRVRV